METEIISVLKAMGKITDEDISEALKMIPSKFEVDLIHDIWDAYCDDAANDHDETLKIWISHFLPILREESFKCMEKVRELTTSIE
jgi:hypothetical protein